MSATIEKKIEALRDKIREHNKNYYVLTKPTISDPEYDKLFQELEKLEKENPNLITPDSPTQKVGSDITEESKIVRHKFPMLSIEKKKDLRKFDEGIKKVLQSNEKVEYLVEPKIDGASVSLEYENGILKVAATRGDGEFGEDITANVRTIKSIPQKIKADDKIPYKLDNIIVRGEIFIYLKDFEKIKQEQKEKGKKVFENPRNTAAGILKTKDSSSVARRPLNNFAYTLLSTEVEFNSQEDNLRILKYLGFRVNELSRKCKDIEEVIVVCKEIEKSRNELPYEIDGVVIKVNSIAQQKKLPPTSNYPKWATAFKFNPEQVTTEIRGITWQVGRTGAITPVAELKPVRLAGSTISRATLHNFDEIKRKDIRIKDKVIIEKGGDVIPKVVEVIKEKGKRRSNKTTLPENCPVCNSKLKKLKDVVAYYCKNPQCPGQLKNLVQHFVSRNALDIKGLGSRVIDKITDLGIIDSPFDLFKLDEETFASLNLGASQKPRFLGGKNANKIIKALEKAKSKPFSKWLFAIGIPKLGEVGAKIIAEKYNTLDEIKNSTILKDIILLDDLKDKAVRFNPRSKHSRTKTKKEKEKLEIEYSKICEQIEDVGDRLVKIDWYKLKQKKSNSKKVLHIPDFTLKSNKGVGAEVAQAILNFLNSSVGEDVTKRMKDFGIQHIEREKLSKLLSGKIFVLTGTLPTMKRPDASELIEKNGGKVSSSVSKNTNYLLAGDKPGSKFEEAKKLGVEIISEADLIKMISLEFNKSNAISNTIDKKQLDIFDN